MRIKTRLIIILLIFSILPAAFISFLLFENQRAELQANALRNLKTIAEVKEAQILEFLSAKRGRTVDFSTDGFIRSSVRAINRISEKERKFIEGSRLGEYLRTNKQVVDPDIIEIHVLDLSGTVIASTDVSFIGTDESDEDYFKRGLKSSYIQGVSEHTHAEKSHRFIPVAAPLIQDGRTIGVIMNGYSIDLADNIISGQRSLKLGALSTISIYELEAIDIYLVNRKGLLLTPSKKLQSARVLEFKVDSFPALSCLKSSREENGAWTDIGGMKVWGSSQCMKLSEGVLWTLIVEQDEYEALAPLRSARFVVIFITLCVAAVAGVTSYAVALSITRPIDELRKGARIISTGNLDHRIGWREQDELGELASDFDKMAGNLKAVTASRDELDREARERIKAIEALRLSETNFRNLVESSLAGIYRSNSHGEFLFVNEAIARIFEFDSAAEMVREGTVVRYKNSADRERILELLKSTGRVDALEVEMVTKKGNIKTILLSAVVFRGVITGTVLDITELKRAEEVTREAERSKVLSEIYDAISNVVTDYQGLLDTVARYIGGLTKAPCVIRILSEDGRWLEPAAFFHSDPELRELMRHFIYANPQSSDAGVGGRLVKEGRQFSYGSPEEIWKTVKPEFHAVMERLGIESVLVTPLRSEGKIIGLIACFRATSGDSFSPEERILIQDLADRAALAISIARLFRSLRRELELREKAEKEMKSYAAELERSNADLEQFAHIASHDLREPLRSMDGFLRLLSRKYKGRLDEKADRFIEFALAGAGRMQRIIDDLLEFSRVSTKAKSFEPTDIGAVLSQALENLAAAVSETRASVSRGQMPVVTADPVQLAQVFQNLIANAIKFRAAEKRPVVHVSAEEREDEWVFSVEDNGIGMNPAYREKIFEMFQRLHGPEYPGTGIGLAVCKKIVERHGGRIWVESVPGAGSTFYFTIPKRA
ncbi:MAG: GAF domain-containing protein [Deltaproteobacteria bacterium]|nr:GAF domain-containing protein [Deltaproteobacteria bacterium]